MTNSTNTSAPKPTPKPRPSAPQKGRSATREEILLAATKANPKFTVTVGR